MLSYIHVAMIWEQARSPTICKQVQTRFFSPPYMRLFWPSCAQQFEILLGIVLFFFCTSSFHKLTIIVYFSSIGMCRNFTVQRKKYILDKLKNTKQFLPEKELWSFWLTQTRIYSNKCKMFHGARAFLKSN